eukprot:1664450-Pyramimonas_sp.AAC.1
MGSKRPVGSSPQRVADASAMRCAASSRRSLPTSGHAISGTPVARLLGIKPRETRRHQHMHAHTHIHTHPHTHTHICFI